MRADALRLVGSAQTNRAMEAELIRVAHRHLGRRPPAPRRDGTGQLAFPWDAELAQAALTYHRTSTRVVRDLYESSARRLEPLYDELRADVGADDRDWLRGARTVSVEVRRMAEFAAGERQVVGTVKNAILDGARARGVTLEIDPERPDLLVVARQDDRGHVVVGLDLSLGTRTRRGWRKDAGEAPLREHLAAVMAIEARYDARRDLVIDPMCGAGTIAIEVALAARGAAVLGTAPPLWPDARPIVIAGDRDLGVLASARDNAKRAGVDVIFHRGDFAALGRDRILALAADAGDVPPGGLVLCNPPWGERLELEDARLLYGAFYDWWRSLGDFRCGVLCAHPALEQVFGQRYKVKKPLSASSNLRSYFYLYEPAG